MSPARPKRPAVGSRPPRADALDRLGAFYLGRRYDLERGETSADAVVYDASDLTTHAVCIGMTGSGKTGLGIVLMEEAALDGVPIIAIDPKGDLGNLLLTFPRLRPQDFRPWVDEARATTEGRTLDEEARHVAAAWRRGITDWGQAPSRVGALGRAVDRAIYTPGSQAGRSLDVLGTLRAPPAAVVGDDDALQEQVTTAVSGLLGLVGLPADPVKSREHVFLSTLLTRAWRDGRDQELATLIHQIQKPPIDRVGVLGLEAFYPASARRELALALNGVMAAPSFSAWRRGEPLDAGRLLRTEDGRPRLSIVSIAHLSEPERMFCVTLVLNELIGWMRRQAGSGSLRALLYMDETVGYLPPIATPPAKRPLLTLLKQARAYGVGLVLATQNPADLDYKALSNAGTWFLGRLSTARDQRRVVEGLRGAATPAGGAASAAQLSRALGRLPSRVFVMRNVHEDTPVVFHTRWALSYLCGPLTRGQIGRLMAGRGGTPKTGPPRDHQAGTRTVGAGQARPAVPSGVIERFRPALRRPSSGERLVYRPALMAQVSLHYARARERVDEWMSLALEAPLEAARRKTPWEGAQRIGRVAPELEDNPEEDATFARLPGGALSARAYKRWSSQLKTTLYRTQRLRLWRSRRPSLVSRVGESEGEFRGRLRERAREARDLAVAKLRRRYAPKLSRVRDQIASAEARIEVEHAQYTQRRAETAISIGATVLGALFGRKLGTIGRASTSMRRAGRAARERGDIDRARDRVDRLRARLADLERQFDADRAAIDHPDAVEPEVTEVEIAPRKADIEIQLLALAWSPWLVGADGVAHPAFEAAAPPDAV